MTVAEFATSVQAALAHAQARRAAGEHHLFLDREIVTYRYALTQIRRGHPELGWWALRRLLERVEQYISETS